MAIPKWVHNNPVTKSLVPMIEEAHAAGYSVDFGPTGKKHPSGKSVAADVNHPLKRIRIDPMQVARDFETKAWTTPQVEGVAPIEHDFETAGDLAKFYLAHELEHTNPQERVAEKAGNENATNQRAMKRILPKPKTAAPAAAQGGDDLVPHSSELLHALQGLGRKSTSKSIKSVIDGLVESGKVRPGAARLLATAVVFAQDRLRGVSEGEMVTAGVKPIDEIYFEGTPQQLKDARARSRNVSRSFYSSSLPPELSKVIGELFKSKEGRQYTMRALRARMRSGKVAESENMKGMLREAQKDVRLSPEMSLKGREDSRLKPIINKPAPKNRKVLQALPAKGPEDAEFIERSQGSPEQIAGYERSMTRNLVEGMTKIDKRKFEKIKARISNQYPDYSEPKVNRVALLEMFPHYDRFIQNYGKKVSEGKKITKERAATMEAEEMAKDVKKYRSVSGGKTRTDQPAMTGAAGLFELRKLSGKFGAPTANPSPRRTKRKPLK
jgi:hypothetical protein